MSCTQAAAETSSAVQNSGSASSTHKRATQCRRSRCAHLMGMLSAHQAVLISALLLLGGGIPRVIAQPEPPAVTAASTPPTAATLAILAPVPAPAFSRAAVDSGPVPAAETAPAAEAVPPDLPALPLSSVAPAASPKAAASDPLPSTAAEPTLAPGAPGLNAAQPVVVDGDRGSAGQAVPPDPSSVPGAAATSLSVAPGTVAQVAAAGVPDRCIIAGSSLFSSCAVEIATTQKRFNISVDVLAPQNYTALLAAQGVTRAEAVDFMRQVLAKPSASCCMAHCKFNQQLLCDCEPSVLYVAVRFAGADLVFYGMLVEQLAAGCGHRLFFNETCPANRTAALAASTARSLDLLTESASNGQVMNGFCLLTNGSVSKDVSTAVPLPAGGG